jgi:hypothetical protein
MPGVGPRDPIGRWVGRLYPTAGEGHAIFRTAREARPAGGGRVGGGASGDGLSADGVSADEVAVRRARGRIRRYCAANLLNRLGTLPSRHRESQGVGPLICEPLFEQRNR